MDVGSIAHAAVTKYGWSGGHDVINRLQHANYYISIYCSPWDWLLLLQLLSASGCTYLDLVASVHTHLCGKMAM